MGSKEPAPGDVEVAKNLDVNHESKRLWAYPLYGCYYFVKGEKAPETEAAAADAGISGE